MPKTTLYHYMEMPDQTFLVDIFERNFQGPGSLFNQHWHEHLQFIYFKAGQALIGCNSQSFQVNAGDLVVINGNELHYGENLGFEVLCYMIRIDFSFLLSNQVDSCQTKYIAPLIQNHIVFKNRVGKDENITQCIKTMIAEYSSRGIGYELAIKASAYELLVLLLRGYLDKVYNEKEHEMVIKNVKRFQRILDYLDSHFREPISIDQLADMSNISKYHFSRLFKQLTGKSAGDYIRQLRINNALTLLRESDLNITEIAMTSGFNDTNYFCRVFKKCQKSSPSKIRQAMKIVHLN
jgi:AraC-like DNA-binding protein